MKKSVRLISILMAMLLCFSCMTTGVWAEYADYSRPAGTNSLDHPVISAYQCGSLLLDKIDEMLTKMDTDKDGKLHGKIGWPLNLSYDARTIDGALHTVHNLVDSGLLDNFLVTEDTVGDLDNVNFNSLLASPYRTTVGSTDLQILYAMFGFLRDNRNLIGKLIDGSWDNGMIGTFLDVNDVLGDVHVLVKEKLFEALFMDGDNVKEGTVVTKTSTLDDMINEFLYAYIGGANAILPSLENEMVKAGAMSAPGVTNFKLNNISVYQLIRYVLRAAIIDFGKPLLSDLLADNKTLWPLFTGLLNITIPEDITEDEAVVDYLVNDILDLRNGALSQFITVTDDGVSLTTNFQTLLHALLETAQGLMGSLTSYDTVEKWTAEEVAQLTEPQMLAYLVRTVLTSMIDYMDIPKTMPQRNEKTGIVTEVPINGYGVATYALINIMADKMPEKDYYAMIENYKNGDPGPKLNPGFVPGKYEEPAAFTVLADYMYYFLNAKTTMAIPEGKTFDETLQWIFNWIIAQFGGLIRTDNLDLHTTPTTQNMVVWKNMDILLWDNVLDITWLPDDYVASFKDSNGKYTGNVTHSILLDNLLYTIVNLDLSQLNNILSLFNTYQGTISGYPAKADGELNQNVIKFVLILVKRILNGVFQGENTLFANTTINSLEDIVSKTKYDGKTNLRWIAENLCTLIAQYGEPILMSALPIVAKSMMNLDEYAENYDIYPVGSPGYEISDLRSRLNSQKPSNELSGDMMTDENYFFFGSEDFDKDNLYKYYNWRTIFREASDIDETYEDDVAEMDEALAAARAELAAARSSSAAADEIQKLEDKVAQKQKDIADYARNIEVLTYRLDYYYSQLVYRAVNDDQLQYEFNRARTNYGYGNYGSMTAKGVKNNSTEFTRKTWNAYNDAYNFAKQVLLKVANDPQSVRQSMITAARELLIVAEKELKFFTGDADYSELFRMIQMAQARVDESIEDATAYVQDTIAQLITALNEAKAVDTGYGEEGQEIIDAAVVTLQEAYDAVIEMPQIAKAIGSTTVLDKTNMYIYGMREKLANYLAYVRNRGVGVLVYDYMPMGDGTGTGAKIGLTLDFDGDIIQQYTVIIFGDVNGDCRADGMDANWVYMYKAHLLDENSIPDYVMDAADVNGDGVVDYIDAFYLRQSGIQKYTVDQRGEA